MAPDIDILLERLRIEQFFADYVQCIDQDKLELWPDFFTEDCIYGIWPRENWEAGLPIPLLLCNNRKMIEDRVLSHREANIFAPHVYRHLYSGIQVQSRENGALAVLSNYLVLQTLQDGETGIYQAGRCFDRLVTVDGAFKFAERKVVYDTSRVQTLLATPI